MTTCNPRVGTGSRGIFSFGEEKCYGVAVPPTKRIDFVSESIQNNIGALVSNALNPNRAVPNLVRGTSDVGGNVAYEQNTNGQGVLFKHALGDSITLLATDGGVRGQLATAVAISATSIVLRANNVSPSLPTAGYITIVGRNSALTLISNLVRYTGHSDSTTLSGVTGVTSAFVEGDRCFLTDSTTYTGVYTHYMEAARTLPTGLTIEVGRDVAMFTYTGMKVNELAEAFPAKELLTGTFTFVGRAEASGADSQSTHVAGDTTITFQTGTFLLQDGTGIVGFRQRTPAGAALGSLTYSLQVQGENDITYVSYNINANGSAVVFGIPSSGTGSLTQSHAAGVPVVPQSTAAESSLTPTTVEPLTSFQAGVYLNSSFQEILAANYTLNNNLFTDKYQLGDRFRVLAPEQRREVKGSVKIEFDDLVMYRRYANSSDAEIEIRIVNDGVTGLIGSTGVYRQKHLIFPRVKFTGATPVIGGPEVIQVDMPFQAIYDTHDDEPELIIIFVNDLERDPYGV